MADIQPSGGGKKGGGKVRTKKNSGKPDMTPMVDLGFLLITFFIYTTTFSKPNTMKLNMPKKEDDPDQTEMADVKVSNTITIIMGKDNRIFWYQKPLADVTAEDLNEVDYSAEGIRTAILKKRANAIDIEKFTVVIKPTNQATWKNTVDILDEMSITESELYAVVDLQKQEQKAYDEKVGNPPANNE
jgi:biopolymer transport protein ExbD